MSMLPVAYYNHTTLESFLTDEKNNSMYTSIQNLSEAYAVMSEFTKHLTSTLERTALAVA